MATRKPGTRSMRFRVLLAPGFHAAIFSRSFLSRHAERTNLWSPSSTIALIAVISGLTCKRGERANSALYWPVSLVFCRSKQKNIWQRLNANNSYWELYIQKSNFFKNKFNEKRSKLKQDCFYYFRKNVLFRFLWDEKWLCDCCLGLISAGKEMNYNLWMITSGTENITQY